MMPNIRFQLRLPSSSLDAVVDPMHALRRAASLLPTREVLPLLLLGHDEVSIATADEDHRLHGLVKSFELTLGSDFEAGKPLVSEGNSPSLHIKLLPDRVVGFSVFLGFGVDRLDLFLGEYPPVVAIHDRRLELPTRMHGWHGEGRHITGRGESTLLGFLVTHLLVVVLLEAAQSLGLTMQASDSTGFFGKRSLDTLIKAFPGTSPPNWFDHQEHIESLGNLAVLADVEDVETIPA